MKWLCWLMILVLPLTSWAQNPTLKLVSPAKDRMEVTTSKQFISGITCAQCTVTVNEEKVKVYTTGTFAYQCNLQPGENRYLLKITHAGKSIERNILFQYNLPQPAQPVSTPTISSIKTFPEGDLILQPGDQIYFEVKAYPGGVMKVKDVPLYELPVGKGADIAGIYKGIYVVKPNDSLGGKLTVTLTLNDGTYIQQNTSNRFSVLSNYASDVLQTKTRVAHLKFGWGDDRLGGAKLGYVDSLIPFQILGKQGKDFKVRLSNQLHAYIEEDYVELLPRGYTLPLVLTSKITISGDEKYDYVKVPLPRRLPYTSQQIVSPSAIEVDLYGAVNNTNWIAHLSTSKAVQEVQYTQVSSDVFRLKILLKDPMHWGYRIYYENNILVIAVKHQPPLVLKNMTIAIDAGHGGKNPGAQSMTGLVEKNMTLDIALRLQKLLEKVGAKVIMTRTTERYFDNRERILFYRDSTPDLLLSIHFNGAVDPINAGGTMVFYRYPGFKPLNEAIYRRMLELGLKPGGMNASFNFMLNSPTEYPNCLIEAMFLSNLEEEEKLVDEGFRQRMAEKIMAGLEDFLQEARLRKE